MEQFYLTTGEFARSMATLQSVVVRGFADADIKFDDHAARMVRLETKLDERTANDKTVTKKTASGYGAIMAALAVGAIEIVKAWTKP